MSTPVRCAVYTRKSSEEGLEQSFNSLDAQREAGLDYIKSQKHQGWVAVPAQYDDGGYSGGNVDRPGLKRLLEDIRDGRIDVVVVYKVDRLSRSLADFARLMQTFDEHKVSFVSVTQQFNTTTSMGRLTLNMLLSFAQFEREVTGERIRDKIAATKRKGVWAAGLPPLGYRVSRPDEPPGDRRLRIVEPEAAIVREIFASYLESHSLLGVAKKMNEAGYTTRPWSSAKGNRHGAKPFRAGWVYKILTNQVYIGKITHTRGGKTEVFDGLHEPIVDRETWDMVHSTMRTIERSRPTTWTHTHLLRGKVRTYEDSAMSPGSVLKRRRHPDGTVSTRRVFYYASQKAMKQGYKNCQIKSINAGHLDDFVRSLVLEHLHATHQIDLHTLDAPSRDHWIREVLDRVIVAPETITVELDPARFEACRAATTTPLSQPGTSAADATDDPGSARRSPNTPQATIPRCFFTPTVEERHGRVLLTLHIKLKRHDGRRVLVAPDGRDLYLTYTENGAPIPQEHLVRAIGQAFAWRREVVKGRATIEAVAKAAGLRPGRVSHLLHLTRLSPTIIRAILTGAVGARITLRDLHAAADHLDWSLQAAALMLRPGQVGLNER